MTPQQPPHTLRDEIEGILTPGVISDPDALGFSGGWLTVKQATDQLVALVERERNTPMGVSQWREHGKKYGYWEYFEGKLTATSQENNHKEA